MMEITGTHKLDWLNDCSDRPAMAMEAPINKSLNKPVAFASIFRKPVRVTITLPHNTYLHLKNRSDEEGRSLSNLAAFLIERSLG